MNAGSRFFAASTAAPAGPVGDAWTAVTTAAPRWFETGAPALRGSGQAGRRRRA